MDISLLLGSNGGQGLIVWKVVSHDEHMTTSTGIFNGHPTLDKCEASLKVYSFVSAFLNFMFESVTRVNFRAAICNSSNVAIL